MFRSFDEGKVQYFVMCRLYVVKVCQHVKFRYVNPQYFLDICVY